MDVCFTSTMCYFKKGRILPVIEFPVYCMQSLPRKKQLNPNSFAQAKKNKKRKAFPAEL